MENQEVKTGTASAIPAVPPPAICSADPFPKWKWMMDYCRERKWHPSEFWDLAEKAWCEKFEPNVEARNGERQKLTENTTDDEK